MKHLEARAALLRVKECDLRMDCLLECDTSIDRGLLVGGGFSSRGYGAAVKGHPGPVLPGVPVATGPLGHGISICCGYAMRRMELGRGNVYCMVGDGELQEGSCWEGAALAADRGLRNLCVLVDQNTGQSDVT